MIKKTLSSKKVKSPKKIKSPKKLKSPKKKSPRKIKSQKGGVDIKYYRKKQQESKAAGPLTAKESCPSGTIMNYYGKCIKAFETKPEPIPIKVKKPEIKKTTLENRPRWRY